jgi:hypothetical protein
MQPELLSDAKSDVGVAANVAVLVYILMFSTDISHVTIIIWSQPPILQTHVNFNPHLLSGDSQHTPSLNPSSLQRAATPIKVIQ